MFLRAVLHDAVWIRNHLEYVVEIIGQQKETWGVAALGLLPVGFIVLSSLRLIKRLCYEFFYTIHCAASFLLPIHAKPVLLLYSMLSFIALFIGTICYHTIYASPWIFPL